MQARVIITPEAAGKPTLFSVFSTDGTRQIRRVLMEKTACHLYYEVDPAAGVVTIVSAWGATQGKLPTEGISVDMVELHLISVWNRKAGGEVTSSVHA